MKKCISFTLIILVYLSFNPLYAINLDLMKSNIQNANTQQDDANNTKENSTNKQNMNTEGLFNQYKEQS
ncbi:hypothetical protein [Francisella frigiditurris]|uniref:Uncharacterized protein n=1 Tax=Francisella frigiditurris TaxID=1542390 RepID=A0A1J0KTS8_9GAMM|nr:hypothetical protein [Francisella frigiditurris]APC97091.1 hypothetical protein KX01_1372 [Francisella frigiditurris]